MTPPHGKASSSFSSIYPTIVISLGAAIVTSALVYQHLSQSKTNRARKSNNKINDGDDDVSSKTSRERTNDDLLHREIEEISLLPQTAEVPGEESVAPRILSRGTITIAYCSTTGTCAGFARRLHDQLRDALEKLDAAVEDSPVKRVQLIRVSEVDWWDELVNNEDEEGDDGDPIHSTDSSNKGNAKKGGSPILLFVLPTWTNGTLPPDGSESLLQSLDDISNDWRVAPEPLKAQNENEAQLLVGAFGMGSSAYDAETVGKPAKEVFGRLVGKLGARPVVGSRNANGNIGNGGGKKRGGKIRGNSLMIGDAEVGDAEISFEKWMNGVMNSIFQGVEVDLGLSSVVGNGNGGERSSNGKGKGKVKSGKGKGNGQQKQQLAKEKEQSSSSCCGGSSNKEDLKDDAGCACKKSDNNNDSDNFGCCSSKAKDEDDNDDSATDSISEDEDDDDYDEDDEDQDVLDVEDMGNVIKSQTSTKRSTTTPKEMVTPKQAKALKKEGYRLIGTHSAVKLCRWTKHQLRGRGGCYKHTHYGITSYQCMEATPSLACANKCVFCWRHHKNPVGREWRWKTDEPDMIVEEAVNTHVSMIKETKGIPGIQMDRWAEAHTVRHCALSLVGEPIMYPRINELLQELHDRKISTFLVTNGQHPQAIRDLIPITQLYVSVDAPTPESLEAVDRPLFRDAWDRLKTSLACLKHKGQRTVARLTVVKGWNSDEIGGYARLIALGHCSLVEVKGVTFCGKSDASNLNMSNTPWHHEVVEFTKVLKQELDAIREEGGEDPLPEYDLACEHKHSCSVLLARVDQFAVPDPDDPTKRKWRTWIDYDKFQELAARHAADPTFKFGVEDYIADTPSWAVFGAEEEGFDPTDNRHRKKKRHPKYTRFDEEGIPTHDTFDEPLKEEEIVELREQMKQKKREVGDASTITEFKSGEKRIEDASLMFRGLVVIR